MLTFFHQVFKHFFFNNSYTQFLFISTRSMALKNMKHLLFSWIPIWLENFGDSDPYNNTIELERKRRTDSNR